MSNYKTNNLVMSLMYIIQGETTHGLGEYSASESVEHYSLGILGKDKFYRTLAKTIWKQGMTD